MKKLTIILIFSFFTALLFMSKQFSSNNSRSELIELSNTYKNEKYGYEISFPSNWVYSEYSDTKTGAAFRPANSSNSYSSEVININVLDKVPAVMSKSLKDYSKIAAMNEIQNYKSLFSFEEVKTSTGLVGYKTRWKFTPLTSIKTQISDPITYFSLKSNSQVTIQVSLSNKKFEAIYNKMIKTLRYSN